MYVLRVVTRRKRYGKRGASARRAIDTEQTSAPVSTQKWVAEMSRDPSSKLAVSRWPSSEPSGYKYHRANYFAISSTSSAAFWMISRIRWMSSLSLKCDVAVLYVARASR